MPNQNNNQNQPNPQPQISDIPPIPDFQSIPGDSSTLNPTVPAPASPPPPPAPSGSPGPQDSPPITSSPKKKFGGGKIIATILGLVILVGGVGAGVLVTQQNQDVREEAAYEGGFRHEKKCNVNGVNQWCWLYNDPQGCENDAGRPDSCDNFTFDENYPCEEVTEPCSGNNTPPEEPPPTTPPPTHNAEQVTSSCLNVKIFNNSGQALTDSDLAKLKPGDTINMCVKGSSALATFDKAQFNVNGTTKPETTTTIQGVDRICDTYTIPAGTTRVEIKARIHTSFGAWFGEAF